MKGIIRYKRYYAVAIPKINMLVVTYQCHKNINNTIVDCKLLVKWANNSEFRISIKDMKEAQSSGFGFFSKARGIAGLPQGPTYIQCNICI